MHNYESKVFDLCVLEFAFVMLQEELVFMKSLQDQMCNATVLLHGFSVDEDVVKVHADHSFHNKVLKDLIHHYLEGRRTVCKPKNITSGLNNLQLILNAAFHSSPSFICTF